MTYDSADNAYRSWDLALATMREMCIRRKQILPREDHPDEVRWASEGERPVNQLDSVRTP
jgi:hypothetical protein